MVQCLAVCDRQHPRAKVMPRSARPQTGVGAQGRDERLLEAILGLLASDGRDQQSPHVLAVLIQEELKRGERVTHEDKTPRCPRT